MPRLPVFLFVVVLALVVALAAACGGGEAEQDTSAPAAEEKNGTPSPATEAPSGPKTFSKYGFSFSYPRELPVVEEGVAEDEPNDASGTVRIAVEGEESRLFIVTWLEAAIFARSLQGSLDAIFEEYEDIEGIESVDRHEVIDTVFEEERILYQFFGATTNEGERLNGIAAAFHCESNHVQFSFLSVNVAISGSAPIVDHFENYFGDYLDSFVCDTR